MAISCTAPRQGHRPGSVAERMCPKHGRQASREVLPVAVAAPVPSDKPTVVKRYDDGTVRSEEWLVDGLFHRIDGPAVVEYHSDGTVEWEEWFVDGKRHRSDGPAAVRYRPDGTVGSEEWFVDGKLHRSDGPAIVWYNPDGSVDEEWYVDGELHRTDGPAVVWYHPDGSVGSESWCVGGVNHRTNGPAYVRYHPDGSVEREGWYMDDREVGGPAPVLAAFLRSRFPHITTSAARFLCESRPWQEWGDISDSEVELAMTLSPNFAEA